MSTDCYDCGRPCDAHASGCLVVAIWERISDLAAAQKRIAELEAEVARHPEVLRRVAEAVTTWCGGGRPPTEGESAHLGNIIASVVKP